MGEESSNDPVGQNRGQVCRTVPEQYRECCEAAENGTRLTADFRYVDAIPFVPSLLVQLRKRLSANIMIEINEMIMAATPAQVKKQLSSKDTILPKTAEQ